MKKGLILLIAFVMFVNLAVAEDTEDKQDKEFLIPVSGMTLTITPEIAEEKQAGLNDLLGIKKVTVSRRRSNVLRLTWYSLVRELAENTVFPTYVMKTRKGILDVSNFSHKTAFLNPIFWPGGFYNTVTSLPLWVDPAYLKLKRRQKRNFFVGLVHFNTEVIKSISVEYREPLLFFKNLHDQYIKSGKVRENLDLKRSEEKRLERFIEDFAFVTEQGDDKLQVSVNGVPQELNVKKIGNDYFELWVLDDPTNPLVLKLELDSRKMPHAFEDSYEKFKKFFEYKISEIEFQT